MQFVINFTGRLVPPDGPTPRRTLLAMPTKRPVGRRLQARRKRLAAFYGPFPACHFCGQPVPPNQMNWHHVIPLAEGGPDVLSNIRPSHASCNMADGARWIAARNRRGRELLAQMEAAERADAAEAAAYRPPVPVAPPVPVESDESEWFVY